MTVHVSGTPNCVANRSKSASQPARAMHRSCCGPRHAAPAALLAPTSRGLQERLRRLDWAGLGRLNRPVSAEPSPATPAHPSFPAHASTATTHGHTHCTQTTPPTPPPGPPLPLSQLLRPPAELPGGQPLRLCVCGAHQERGARGGAAAGLLLGGHRLLAQRAALLVSWLGGWVGGCVSGCKCGRGRKLCACRRGELCGWVGGWFCVGGGGVGGHPGDSGEQRLT